MKWPTLSKERETVFVMLLGMAACTGSAILGPRWFAYVLVGLQFCLWILVLIRDYYQDELDSLTRSE